MSAAAETSELLVTRDGGVVTLTLNRPGRRHALSLSLLEELEKAIAEIAKDRTARVVVLASSGNVYSSGHDLGEMRDRTGEEYERLFGTCSRVMQRIRKLPQPVIARVQGFATAAGCQLVAACDLAVASETAQFATPGVKIGLFCTTPMVPLVRNIAPKIAMEMLLTGQPISAQKALAAGLLNAVAPEDQLDAIIKQYTDSIVSSSPQVIALGKREFYLQKQMEESAAYDRAVMIMTQNAQMRDAQEGISAFLEKRKPQWGE
ncbi:enoyl-CoA hydratase [Planctomicrobium piriforme]|uniref:Enoyl-CoA hydratase domain-containing protein 3, mitochondrial n=1 Tax=Planctomicrobium piriforme TaxID=1576369 RepID=A0A1I3DC27_9PLAN|nr:enoyl-CoA hydratase [Planctomicrobium piriforme]SFH84267.1 Enoyl-CoA hydratase/carnithine racemase [Planctomicrobium piriforme]